MCCFISLIKGLLSIASLKKMPNFLSLSQKNTTFAELRIFFIIKFTIMKNISKTISKNLKAVAKYTSILVITLLASVANIKANTITDQQAQTTYKKYDSNEIPPASHEKLLASNENYRKNFEIAQDFVLADADKICTKIAGEGKLSSNDNKVFLLTNYYSFVKSPKLWNTEAKKSYIILRHGVEWNRKSKEEIDTKFENDMKDAKIFLRDGNAGELKKPIYFSKVVEETSIDEL